MKINFNIAHLTSNCLVLNLVAPQNSTHIMNCDQQKWHLELDIPSSQYIEYYYSTADNTEWGVPRHLKIEPNAHKIFVDDRWREKPSDTEKYTSAFCDIFYANQRKSEHENPNKQVELIVDYTGVEPNCELVMVGESDALGNWNTALAPRFHRGDYPFWHLKLSRCDLYKGQNYKLAIVNSQNGTLVRWEEGPNRIWTHNVEYDQYYILNNLKFRSSDNYKWRGAGVAIPVFSLRSENSAGIGDFDDLAQFTTWAGSIGLKVVQILPINDTTISHTRADSYPYNAISVYALHPLYLSLEKMGVLQDVTEAQVIAEKLQNLNNLELLDYEEVDAVKWQFFRAMYKQDGRKLLQTDNFKTFFNTNQEWLVPYATFCFLRDINNTVDYNQWGKWKNYNRTQAEKLLNPDCVEYDNIAIYLYLQYHLHSQLLQAKNIAAAAGVALKGDIPIGVSRLSVDTWVEPQLFNLNSQAGAPPDDFAQQGQNWGFPTYNWTEMAKDNYNWWRKRFLKMNEYFQLYRIDHILGFFRIWQIPINATSGLLGHFNPALPYSLTELQNFNFTLHKSQLTPNFSRTELKELLGRYRNLVNEYFEPTPNTNNLTLKPRFDTQRKIISEITDQPLTEILLSASADLLFIEDKKQPQHYHPRIEAQKTYAYKRLSHQQQQAFDNLYQNYFYHRHNDFWANSAMTKLPQLINATPMMCCAEDLGMIPDCVAPTLTKLQIATLEIERMPKLPWEKYGNILKYNYLSVCSTSTHDISPLRLWWEQLNNEEQTYYFQQILNLNGQIPPTATEQLSLAIINRHLQSQSILTIIPLQDWLALNSKYWSENSQTEQINIPANPNHYWRYRMPTTIEELEIDEKFKKQLKNLIAQSGRN